MPLSAVGRSARLSTGLLQEGLQMATLATQFKDALGNIEPGDDAKNAADAHKQVSAVLEADERLKALGVSCFLIGSYGRDGRSGA